MMNYNPRINLQPSMKFLSMVFFLGKLCLPGSDPDTYVGSGSHKVHNLIFYTPILYFLNDI